MTKRERRIILIFITVSLAVILLVKLAGSIWAKGDNEDQCNANNPENCPVPTVICGNGEHTGNPHCFTPSPEPTPTPDCSITPSVTPTIAISPTNSLTPTETISPTETATPSPTASITEAPLYHEEVVEDRVIYVWPGESVQTRGANK